MQFALNEDLLDHVNVSPTISGILMLPADQSAQQTLNAPQPRPVRIYIAWIPAPMHNVETMHNVKL